MKRFWLGFGILAAFLAAGVFAKGQLEDQCRRTGLLVQQASGEAAAGNFAGAEGKLEQARQVWEKKDLLVSALCDHRSLEQAQMLLAELEAYAREQDAASFRACGSRLLLMLQAMAASQRLDWHNLF